MYVHVPWWRVGVHDVVLFWSRIIFFVLFFAVISFHRIPFPFLPPLMSQLVMIIHARFAAAAAVAAA